MKLCINRDLQKVQSSHSKLQINSRKNPLRCSNTSYNKTSLAEYDCNSKQKLKIFNISAKKMKSVSTSRIKESGHSEQYSVLVPQTFKNDTFGKFFILIDTTFVEHGRSQTDIKQNKCVFRSSSTNQVESIQKKDDKGMEIITQKKTKLHNRLKLVQKQMKERTRSKYKSTKHIRVKSGPVTSSNPSAKSRDYLRSAINHSHIQSLHNQIKREVVHRTREK